MHNEILYGIGFVLLGFFVLWISKVFHIEGDLLFTNKKSYVAGICSIVGGVWLILRELIRHL
jgi:hypothetical protein